jgi:UDP-N-acetyl-D-glucosamine dehydrogenase
MHPVGRDNSLLTDYRSRLLQRLESKTARVAVIGLGYVGLPLAVTFAEAGYHVTGIDEDAFRVDAVNAGESYISDVSADCLRMLLDQGRLTATTDRAALAQCDAVSVCVPTPLRKTGDPDISYVVAATDDLVKYLHLGMLLVLESTTYPGTTTEIVLPRLEEKGPDFRVGETIFLAYSPERVDPGRTDWVTRTTPKVIGGATPACLEVATAYYAQAIETLVPVSSTESAEMVKLLENTFRAVNIGLANEVLLMCDKLGLDAWEVIEAAGTKPFGFTKFTPGPGLGGHCIPIDPLYLSWRLKTLSYNARFIELASEVNTNMPRFWVQKIQDALNEAGKAVKGSRILVLGVAYKKDVSDVRESPAIDIMQLLQAKGALVRYHDPHVPVFKGLGMEMTAVPDLYSAVRESDCVVIVTDHSLYDWNAVHDRAQLLVDTRGVARPGDRSSFRTEEALPLQAE